MSLFQPQRTGDDAEFIDGMRRVGATSPASACSDRDLPRLSRERLGILLDSGVLREGAPGTYYLYENAHPARVALPLSRPAPARGLVPRLIFWLIMILLPVIFLQFRK